MNQQKIVAFGNLNTDRRIKNLPVIASLFGFEARAAAILKAVGDCCMLLASELDVDTVEMLISMLRERGFDKFEVMVYAPGQKEDFAFRLLTAWKSSIISAEVENRWFTETPETPFDEASRWQSVTEGILKDHGEQFERGVQLVRAAIDGADYLFVNLHFPLHRRGRIEPVPQYVEYCADVLAEWIARELEMRPARLCAGTDFNALPWTGFAEKIVDDLSAHGVRDIIGEEVTFGAYPPDAGIVTAENREAAAKYETAVKTAANIDDVVRIANEYADKCGGRLTSRLDRFLVNWDAKIKRSHVIKPYLDARDPDISDHVVVFVEV